MLADLQSAGSNNANATTSSLVFSKTAKATKVVITHTARCEDVVVPAYIFIILIYGVIDLPKRFQILS